jgi:DNA-binding NtrC family response regulator
MAVLQTAKRVADSTTPVLVQGEKGTGKTLLARFLHERSRRCNGPFVSVHCAGVPEHVLESDIFGYEKGAFAGAAASRAGRVERAHGGTFLLDEAAELPQPLQAKMLRVIQESAVERLGGEKTVSVDVRFLATTSCPLEAAVASGRFLDDLYSRLAVVAITLPPLRERADDIPHLAEYCVARGARDRGWQVETIAPETLQVLRNYSWPGNVRQLENVIERMVVVGRGSVATLAELPSELRVNAPRAITASSVSVAVAEPSSTAVDVVDDLYARLTRHRECFWTTVYPLYMQREITRSHMRDLVKKGLEEARGNYKIMVQLFNMDASDYKKFLNFLRKHQCQLPFKDYRQVSAEYRGVGHA